MTKRIAYIVTGPESSGSVFVSKVIAHVLGLANFGEWSGHGFCGDVKSTNRNNVVVLHRSQPFGSPGDNYRFYELNEFERLLKGYTLKFIITTRYRKAIESSKLARFKRTDPKLREHYNMSTSIITKILSSKYPKMIWNYETMLYLKKVYFDVLYKFIGVRSDYIPTLIDGNEKYFS